MTRTAEKTYPVNALAPDPAVKFDRKIAEQYLTYARRLSARGYVASSTGNLVMRVPHRDYPDGICYVKCMGVSLEEMTMDDLILTDVSLPGMSGFDLATQVRARPASVRTPILCISGYSGDEFEQEARNAGCNRTLLKPCLPDDLARAIAELLSESEDRRQS